MKECETTIEDQKGSKVTENKFSYNDILDSVHMIENLDSNKPPPLVPCKEPEEPVKIVPEEKKRLRVLRLVLHRTLMLKNAYKTKRCKLTIKLI